MSLFAKKPLPAKRRFFQFGLRTVLLVMTVFSVWLGVYVHRSRRQQEAVRAIREAGGWVYYDFQEQPSGSGKFDVRADPWLPKWLVATLKEDFLFDVVEVNLVYSNDSGRREENTNFSGDVLRHVTGFPKLKMLLLSKGQATDAGLKYVGALPALEGLYMWDAHSVTDAGIANLSQLKKLKSIHVSNSRITDRSLAILSSLPSLEKFSLQGSSFTDAGLSYLRGNTTMRHLWIGLGDTNITDEGAAFLAEVPNLEQLDLQKTKITTKALEHLKRLTKLTHLVIGGTRVSHGDIRSFQRSRPNCKISQ